MHADVALKYVKDRIWDDIVQWFNPLPLQSIKPRSLREEPFLQT